MPLKQLSVNAFVDKVGLLQIVINDSIAYTARLEEATKVSLGLLDICIV